VRGKHRPPTSEDQIHPRLNKSNPLPESSSPPVKPMPTIHPSRFGYTGPHDRRGGTGALVVCRHAGGSSGAAQKMVSLSPSGGACVCRTQPGMASVLISTELNSIPPQRDRSCADKYTERGTSRVTIKISIEAHDVSRPKLGLGPGNENNHDRQGRTASFVILGPVPRTRPHSVRYDLPRLRRNFMSIRTS